MKLDRIEVLKSVHNERNEVTRRLLAIYSNKVDSIESDYGIIGSGALSLSAIIARQGNAIVSQETWSQIYKVTGLNLDLKDMNIGLFVASSLFLAFAGYKLGTRVASITTNRMRQQIVEIGKYNEQT